MWNALSRAVPGEAYALPRGTGQSLDWSGFCSEVESLPEETFWRHNQAGDLPGTGDRIDLVALAKLAQANTGRRGFTYTHKPVTGPHGADNAKAIAEANARGFTINLSADNLSEADELSALNIGPVVVVLPESVHGNVTITTPAGRRVSVCPATYRDEVTCASCQLCQRVSRKTIVGFPAHGASRRKASNIAKG